ncbi:hypothetical protein ACRAWD_06990 [Caulobacter segnis]
MASRTASASRWARSRPGPADPGTPPGQQRRRQAEVAGRRPLFRLARHHRLLSARLFPAADLGRLQSQQLGAAEQS